jgi:IPT/TIG domain-containing protein
LTTAILNAGTHGLGINLWTLSNSTGFSVCTAGDLPTYTNTTTNGTTYPAEAGTRGICYNMTSGGEAYEAIPPENLTVTAYVNVNVGTNVTGYSAPVFVGAPGVDSAAFAINSSSQLELECSSANPVDYPISPTTLAVANTTYGIWLQYVGGGMHSIRIYSNPMSNPQLIGTASCPAQGTNYATEVGFGEFNAGAVGLAGTREFDSFMWDISGAGINIAPAGNTVSSFSDFENGSNGNAVTAAILNAGTHGAGVNQWTVDAGAFTVCTSGSFPTYLSTTVIGGSTYPAGEGTRGICFNLQDGGEALETIDNPTVTLYVNVNLGAIASVYSNPVIIGDFGVDDAGFTINSSGQLEIECPFASPEDYPISGSNQAQPNTTYGIWLQYVAGGRHTIKIYSNPVTNPQLIGSSSCPAQGTHNATTLGFGDFHGGASGTATIREFDSLLWDVSGNGITVVPTGSSVQVTVGTSPAGLSFSVDGTPYTSAQILTWTVGSQHTLSTTQTQNPSAGTQDSFTSWSNGTATVSDTVTASTGTTSYTASFSTSYQLTTSVSPAAGGTVTPATGAYYAPGTAVPLVATPNANYSFASWTGNVASSSSASTTVTMSAPESVTANFSTTGTAPAITSANNTTFTVGVQGSFVVTASGSPTPSITEAGALPSGVTFNTATNTLSGTPAASTAGPYNITFTASNGAGANAVQNFTLTVGGPTILLGDSNVETSVDYNTLGQAQAWPYTASTTGTVSALSFYADSSSGNGPYLVGIYADASGTPGALLSSGSIATTGAGKWNSVTLATSVNVTAGVHYWLAMLGVSGNMVRFRDDGTACNSSGSATGLKALPATWTSTATWQSCPASVYGSGTAGAGNPPPNITGLSPASGTVSTSVTISGMNFGSSGTVTFNGTSATATSWTATSIVVPVPSAATTGNVLVTVGGLTSNGVGFTVTPNITSLSAASGIAGTSVTITGTGFGATQNGGTVTFNGASATVMTWSAASIVVPVPNAATSGNIVVTVGGVASNGVSFSVTPNITSLSPPSAAVGTSVTITGTGFGSPQGSSTVTFNTTAATPMNWTDTSIVVPVPNGATTGNVVVTVGGAASVGVSFTVSPTAPDIMSLSPSTGIVGTTVTISGTNFGASGTVTFNGTSATAMSWSATSIVVPVPTAATTGNVVVTVGGVASNGVSFTVTPQITSLSAASGVVTTAVTIAGTGFGATQNGSTVTFNGASATVTSWSATSIVVPVPSAATSGNVVVTVAGVASNGVSFTVIPSITSLSPVSGAVSTSVTITGTGFGTPQGSSTVTFNTTAATPTSWSTTKIVVPVPSGATTGNVVVTVGGVASNGISFTVTPHIASLSPGSGVAGTSVTITGTSFGSPQGSSTVTFNTTAATPMNWTDTSIVVPVPNGATTGNVVVTVGGVASNGVSFTVSATAPSITSLSPASGVVGTSVTIMGTNFGASKGSSTVKFNGTTATPASWTAASIVVPVPSAATTGNVVVTVGGVASNGVSFTVTPNIASLSPVSGAVAASVTITGTGFGTPQGSSTVTFNSIAATPTSWSATKIVVPVPSGATTGNVVVTVGGVASNGVSFTVTPHITSLSPVSGAVGASVTITGTTFGAMQGSSTVTFNGTAATPTGWTATSIVAPVPSGATTGNVVVTVGGVASNGVSFTVGHTIFVGDSNVEASVDYNTLGQAQAWPYTAGTTGTVSTLWFYADSSSGNGPYLVGIYADASGTPGALLSSGSIATTGAGKWNSVTLATTVNVTAGVHYWLALLGVSGNMVRFRDDGTACNSSGSATGLKALPATWTSTATWQSCPASIYGSN